MQGVNYGEAGVCKHHQNGCWGCLYVVRCNWQVFQVGKKHIQALV